MRAMRIRKQADRTGWIMAVGEADHNRDGGDGRVRPPGCVNRKQAGYWALSWRGKRA